MHVDPMIIKRPCVARAVLQSPLVGNPFPPDLQNIIPPKPYDRLFTSLNVSQAAGPMSRVMCHMSHAIFLNIFFNIIFILQKKLKKWWS